MSVALVCWFQLCLNVAGEGMACSSHGKGSIEELTSFIKLHQGTAKIVLSECPKPGDKPSLDFNLTPGLRPRKDDAK